MGATDRARVPVVDAPGTGDVVAAVHTVTCPLGRRSGNLPVR